jgi:hypothetical protein
MHDGSTRIKPASALLNLPKRIGSSMCTVRLVRESLQSIQMVFLIFRGGPLQRLAYLEAEVHL